MGYKTIIERIQRTKQYRCLSSKKYHDRLEGFMRFISPNPGNMLDFGCGNMSLDVEIAKQFPNLIIRGLDIANYPLSEIANFKNMTFTQYHGSSIPFEDEIFEYSLASAALHHTNNPKTYLKEIKRVTKQDGKIIIIEEAARTKLGSFIHKCNDRIRNSILNPHIVGSLCFLTDCEWQSLFKDLHLKVEDEKRFNSFPYFPVNTVYLLSKNNDYFVRPHPKHLKAL